MAEQPLGSGRSAGLDLLRGVAVALVILHHSLPELLPGAGVVGVVMFFALSGHLITGVLLHDLVTTGRVDLRRFYARRAARLVPALLVLLVGVVVVTLVMDPLHDRARLPATLLMALTWTGDMPFFHGSAATFHLWTLAVEEQFYLVWPVVLIVGFARDRTRTALLLVGALTLAAAGATTWWLAEAPDLAYALPTSWAVCFVIGAASRLGALPQAGRPMVTAAGVTLAILCVVHLRGHVWTYLGGGPLIAVSTVVLITTVGRHRRITPRYLTPLVALGVTSYSAYLWNYPLTVWLRPALGEVAGVTAAVLTLVVAQLSHRYVELPSQRALNRRWVVRR